MSDSPGSYAAFAERILATGILSDPWFDAAPRFREDPLVLGTSELDALYRVAEDVTAVYDELCRLVLARPALMESFYGLTPWQKAMWVASAPMWHAIARADVFVTNDGIRVAELNCDTPTGEAEAVLLSALAAEDHPTLVDPNRALGKCCGGFVASLDGHRARGASSRTVGIVYPTEFTEDLAVVRLYRRWLEERGFEVVLGSPYNLHLGERGPMLFDRPISTMLRHYKSDWWSERSSVWLDETIPDAAPLSDPLSVALNASVDGTLSVVNPFGAVVPQNKRSMALMWERLGDFSPWAQGIIRAHVPESVRLETLDPARLVAERAAWVIKSDFGAEGNEVIVGRSTGENEFRLALTNARPEHWIAQRYFAAREDDRGQVANHGIYLVAGQAAGIYVRVQAGPTDERAVSVPVLVAAEMG